MNLDKFVKDLINDSKYFLDQAKESNEEKMKLRYIRAVITTIWSALEGWINCVSSDFVLLPEKKLQLHEKAFLSEKKFELTKKGEFKITKRDQYNTIEDKILFLLKRFGNYEINKNSKLWNNFKITKKLRNGLVHPKLGKIETKNLTIKNAEIAINSVIDMLKLLTKKIYKKDLKI